MLDHLSSESHIHAFVLDHTLQAGALGFYLPRDMLIFWCFSSPSENYVVLLAIAYT